MASPTISTSSPSGLPRDAFGGGRLFTVFGALAWAYLGTAILIALFLRTASDRWWVGTLVLLGPRWVWWLPILALAPVACLVRLRSLPVLLTAGLVVLGPVMGLRVGWKRTATASADRLRVLTCNIHHHALRRAALASLIEHAHPDVVALEEWSPSFQHEIFGAGWHCLTRGELFLASRFPITRAQTLAATDPVLDPGFAVHYAISTPFGEVPVIVLHLASPHPAANAVLERSPFGAALIRQNTQLRHDESAAAAAYAGGLDARVIVCGDFNLPIESPIFRQYWVGFTDGFSAAGQGFGYTYYVRRTALRIDHVLAGRGWTFTNCQVLPSIGSPHRPLLADLEQAGQ